jgi:four helix bundle protein
MKRTDLEERLIDFSVLIIEISANLKRTKPAMILENQILRSGTSCSLNYGEATGAESDKDFIHKLQIVLKELRETYMALRIIGKANLCKEPDHLNKGKNENNQLIAIFVKTIKTLKGYR